MSNFVDELDKYTLSLDKNLSWEEREELISEKSRELKNKYKKKKRKKSRKKKLDARREAYLKCVKEENPDITEKELEEYLNKYSALENMLLDMDMEYNKKISELREQLIKKYDISNPDILANLKKHLIDEEISKKKEYGF